MNVTVIGGGPGGYEAALYAAKLGCAVTLVERDTLGGTCLNRGCIPTKSLLAVSDALHEVQAAGEFGISVGETAGNFASAFARKDKVVSSLVSGIGYLMKANGVRVVAGTGRLKNAHTVAVALNEGGTEEIPADKILLATGSQPAVPPVFPYDGKTVLTSDEVLSLGEKPSSIAIVGGGVIGCEVGQFLSRMGVQVTILEMMEHLLPSEDRDVARQIERQFKKEKIRCLCGQGVSAMAVENGSVRITLQDGSMAEAEKALISIGRRPATRDLGLEELGIRPDGRGFLPVDGYMQTAVPGIYAIGDIVSTPQLAHVASREGLAAVDHMCARAAGETSYRAVPRCVYTSPEVASVGLTEAECAKRGIPCRTGSFPFQALGKAKAAGKTDGFAKIIVDELDVILGGAIVGAHATDMLQVLTLAVDLGLTAKRLGRVIFPHPTLSEAILEAAHDVHGLSVHKG